ncbi:MAG TPA: alanine racemase, partial [Chitinophagaceae bacterium]|nr:alanine racemase [Chitinophagaceae bacterium]
ADLTSLRMALQFLKQQSSGLKRTVILSDFYESGHTNEDLYGEVAALLILYNIEKLIGIGSSITNALKAERALKLVEHFECAFYPDTDSFIHDFKSSHFTNECILIKGARLFGFERIVHLFDAKVHQTLLEINLAAIAHNLKQYQQIIKRGTKVMAMVKAFAYGSGGAEIAGILQYNNIDYLSVAYADEGIDLRKAGISVPLMVMNADEESFQSLVEHNLQPVLYSMHLLFAFEAYLNEVGIQHYPVHIEVETGMNRLGFALAEIDELAAHISKSGHLKIESVFSHLAASDNEAQDTFTHQQAVVFKEAVSKIEQYIAYPFIKHIANSAAIIRHPQLQLDMVRLGIGLYGIEIATHVLALQQTATLRTTIAQIKKVCRGETVSYNRTGVVQQDAVIATTRIGYADGFSRRLGNGVGKMWINGRLAPVIGAVCMDMTMIDITGIENVQEGDEVIVFGADLPIEQVADWLGTIPYEVMTSVSQRVKRIYFQE